MGEPREVMDRITEAAMNKDSEALKALYAPDAVAETPDEGTIKGRDEVIAYLGGFLEAFPDGKFESSHKHESRSDAVDEGYFVGTHTGPLTGPTGETIEATGKSVRLRSCDIATVEDGAVRSHRFYFNPMDLLEQLGLAPEG